MKLWQRVEIYKQTLTMDMPHDFRVTHKENIPSSIIDVCPDCVFTNNEDVYMLTKVRPGIIKDEVAAIKILFELLKEKEPSLVFDKAYRRAYKENAQGILCFRTRITGEERYYKLVLWEADSRQYMCLFTCFTANAEVWKPRFLNILASLQNLQRERV